MERGPPRAYDRHTTYEAVDRWSPGASARSAVSPSQAYTDYDSHVRLAPGDGSGATVQEQAGGGRRELTPILRSGVAANGAGDVSTVLLRSPTQLQKKFNHAGVFGVTGNYSKGNAAKFSSAMHEHMNAGGTQSIVGTYRNAPATHYLDPASALNVVSDLGGNFVTAYRLGYPRFRSSCQPTRCWFSSNGCIASARLRRSPS
ncbi:colicin D domain-containing protein [Mumia sp. zg.B53]|uniref:colicin D domain-containing protein n=1 Tax=Mumia sp. zg.B53 TaxID=2855449 RepID=UPI0035ABF677